MHQRFERAHLLPALRGVIVAVAKNARAEADREVVLVGEACDREAARFGAFGKAGELDVRGDVRLADGLQRIVPAPVLRVARERAGGAAGIVKNAARMAVVHRQREAARELRGERVDPVERVQAHLGRVAFDARRRDFFQPPAQGVVRRGVVVEHKARVLKIDAPLAPRAIEEHDEMHRQGVEEFVGKMHAGERLQLRERRMPRDFHPGECAERFLLPPAQRIERFDNRIADRIEELPGVRARGVEHVAREVAVVGTLLDDAEFIGLPEPLPHFGELRREQFSEQRADAHIREKIAVPADRGAARGVVAVLRVIQRQFHEPAERNRAARRDLRTEEGGERGIAGWLIAGGRVFDCGS